jgi:phosphoglycolate phosphatase-like HAD superfamily hydrolase
MEKRVIIFDFDGTLADSFDFVTALLVEQAGKPTMDLEARQKMFGGLSIRQMAEKLGMSFWRSLWLFFYGRRVMTKHMREVKPFPGIESVIKSLHAQGHLLFALSSNRNDNIQIFLREHGLAKYFAGTLGSASIVGKKKALRTLLWRREVKAANCIYVGDEVGDIDAASHLGIATVAVAWGFNDISALAAKKPSAIAESPTDLVKILDTKG